MLTALRGQGTFAAAITVTLWLVAAQAAQGVVEGTGEAQIKGGDKVAAKKAAVADALKRCIEQVVGISIRTEFTSDMQETVKNNESTFNAKVREQLTTKADGFIEKYDVIDEKIEGDVMKVTVRASVYESKVKAEVKKLADLIAAAGNPKLMLVIQDVHVDAKGKRSVKKESVLASYLEKSLLERGFELRGQRVAKAAADDSEADFDKMMNNGPQAAATARDQGADIIIYGRVEVLDKGTIEDAGGLDALKGQTRIEITSIVRGINAATGEVFSSKPVQMSSIGINAERALHRAFKGRGQNLVVQTFDTLLEDLKASFQKTADNGQSYEVSLLGIKSFRTQGKRFLTLLEAMSGVSSVKQKAFDGGNLTVDLNCKCSAGELQDRIFQAVDGTPDLSTLDVKSVSGKQLAFTL